MGIAVHQNMPLISPLSMCLCLNLSVEIPEGKKKHNAFAVSALT